MFETGNTSRGIDGGIALLIELSEGVGLMCRARALVWGLRIVAPVAPRGCPIPRPCIQSPAFVTQWNSLYGGLNSVMGEKKQVSMCQVRPVPLHTGWNKGNIARTQRRTRRLLPVTTGIYLESWSEIRQSQLTADPACNLSLFRTKLFFSLELLWEGGNIDPNCDFSFIKTRASIAATPLSSSKRTVWRQA